MKKLLLVSLLCAVGVSFSARAQNAVTNIAQLLTLNPDTIREAGIIFVHGKVTKGDWGAPKAVTLQASAPHTVDTNIVFAASGGRYWVVAWDGDPRVFGAKGDGVTDDTVALQKAFDYGAAAGYEIVFPPNKTFLAAGLRARTGSWTPLRIRGASPFNAKQSVEGSSVLKLKNSANVPLLIAESGSPIQIRDMTFDGNRANNTTFTNMIELLGTGYDETLAQNSLFIHSAGHAIFITRDETRFESCKSLYHAGDGIYYSNTTDHQLKYFLTGYNDGNGLTADNAYYTRYNEIDSYQNKGHGFYMTNCINARMDQVQLQDNWKSGLRAMCWDLFVDKGNLMRNNIDTNYHGANPYATGTYSEVELFGTSQNSTFSDCTFGERVNKTKLPAYLIDDQRTLSSAQKGLAVRIAGGTASTGSGYVTGRWQSWTERSSSLDGIYDIVTGRRIYNTVYNQASVSSYPYSVKRDENIVIAAGTGRSIVLPSIDNVPDNWTVTIVDAAGNAETNAIVVSAASGTVLALSSYSLYNSSGVWTFVKSSSNYGLQAFSHPEALLSSAGSYFWQTRNGPRLDIRASQDRDSVGIPVVLRGYSTTPGDWNRLRFYGAGGTSASPTGMLAGSSIGQLEWQVRRSDGTDSSSLARIMGYTDDLPTSSSAAGKLYFQTMRPNNGGQVYAGMHTNGAWFMDDTGVATAPNSSALLDLRSTTRGLLVPRMTTVQRDLITPYDGLVIQNTTAGRSQSYQSGAWVDLGVLDGDLGDISKSGSTWTIDNLAIGTNKLSVAAYDFLSWHAMTNALVAGANISFAYDTGTRKLTVTSTGGTASTNGTPMSFEGAILAAGNVVDSADLDFTLTSATNITAVYKADSVALGTDTTGNYIATIAGTANEITVTGSGAENAATTLSLPSSIDLGSKTSLEIPNAASPTTTIFGQVAGKNNAWAAGRGAIQTYDGTANTYVVAALASDTPSNGQVPTFNTGGTITWETPASAANFTVNNVTEVEIKNTTSASLLFDYTIPAGTLGSNGDEVEIYIPLTYMTYNSMPSLFELNVQMDYAATGETTAARIAPVDPLLFTSTTYGGYLRVRIKRWTSTAYTSITEFVIGADDAGDIAPMIHNVSHKHNQTMDTGWASDVRAAVVLSLSNASTLHGMKALGYTVRKIR